MNNQLKNLRVLMVTFLDSNERFLTIYDPLGFDFTLTVDERTLFVTRNNQDLITFNAATGQINFNLDNDDIYSLTNALVYLLQEWYPDMHAVLETLKIQD